MSEIKYYFYELMLSRRIEIGQKLKTSRSTLSHDEIDWIVCRVVGSGNYI